jgi:hypothetical protein
MAARANNLPLLPWSYLMPDNRPAPHLDRFLQFIVPPEHLPELAGWLAVLRDCLTGRQPPASVLQPRMTRRLEEYIELTARGAREAATARAGDRLGLSALPAPAVLGPAQPLSVSEAEEITTTQAQDLTGVSAEWWRRLAIAGRIRARQAPRKVWMLNRADVIAYGGKQRSGTGGTGGSDDGTPGGEPHRADSRSGTGRSPAA